jgi:hypothetical protein
MHSEEESQTEHEVDHWFDSLATNVADTAGVPESRSSRLWCNATAIMRLTVANIQLGC